MKVLKSFTDEQDNGHVNWKGDDYPRAGLKPSDKRVEYLASDKNKLGVPVIEAPALKGEKQANKKEKEGE
jgi:hypothetical protein